MKILSKRLIMRSATNKKKHCFDIIFEWEDIIAKELQRDVLYRSSFEFWFDEKCRGVYKKVHVPLYRMFNLFDWKRGNNVLIFDVSTKQQDGIYNSSRYIPCLIDYFLSDDMYSNFLKAYSRNPLVLISNKDVYEYLKGKNCPIRVEHFPLSISDMYRNDKIYEKEYDLIIAGRENPLLMTYVDRYEKKYPEAKIVKRKYENGHFLYYLTISGKVVSIGDEREDYIRLLRKSKVALYTTPGMDGTRTDANGWNQVTPRFLEEVAAQCHVIARYPDNEDTRWYKMNEICKSVESYEEFEQMMKLYCNQPVNVSKYNQYLERHYTSRRVELLRDIFINNGLEI